MRKRRQYNEAERYLFFDAITGVWNRYYFGTRDMDYRNGEEKFSVAAMYISLSGIREINEDRGFLQGDQYIKEFSELLAAEFGKNACYRMSGNEFVVLLEHFEEDDAMAEREAFEELLEMKQLANVSLGYAWAAAPDALEDIVSRAEREMRLNEHRCR